MEKCKQKYVLQLLGNYISTTTNFDLWMFHGTHDVFSLVIYVLKKDKKPKQITIGLFEASEIT